MGLCLLAGALGGTMTACDGASTLSSRGGDANPEGTAPDPWADAAARAARAALEDSLPPPVPATPESLDPWLVERARRLASLPYASEPTRVPPRLRDVDYAAYRALAFRPEAALWRDDTSFALQLAHPGFLYNAPVDLHVVADGRVDTLRFDAGLFRYDSAQVEGRALPDPPPPEAGYAGFRLFSSVARDGETQEVASFLGASYFRLVGRDQRYGLSARGLAVDVADPDGEEFPLFRDFWLVRPAPGATSVTVFALLDSPSVTGAYRFEVRPGVQTEVDVDARLFARDDVGKLGVAPLTSMYLFGPREAARFDDYRPRVHDSQGLLSWSGRGEWIWRPLSNGPGLRVTSLRDRDPRGFGLVQRDRTFDAYLDAEALYNRRPSLWVRPLDVTGTEGGWGGGGVELVEIPTPSEFNDNIVASWVPDAPIRAGESRRYRYRLRTFGDRLAAQDLLQVERTREGWDVLPGEAEPPPRTHRRFVVDFGGGEGATGEAGDGAGPGEVEAVVETTAGTVADVVVQPLPAGGWRAAFALRPDGSRRADLRLYLAVDGAPISETWSYLWDPASVAR